MLAYVANTLIPVSDTERALRFYVNLLGFEKRGETTAPDGDRQIAIAPRRGRGTLTLVSERRARQRRNGEHFAGVILGTANIQVTYRQLRARGVTFIEAPNAQPSGMLQARLLDEDGNGLLLIQP
jgi:catechol 2,3-dioxygenase-like lactoylglutathione lyase family enzyme